MPVSDIRAAEIAPSLEHEGFLATKLPLRLDPDDALNKSPPSFIAR